MIAPVVAALLSMSPIVSTEMVFEEPPRPSCHASTLAWTRGGFVAAWFGGTAEGESDVGVWLSRRGPHGWSTPREVARDAVHPCWNPVLFAAGDERLQLYHKVGPSPREWRGMVVESADGGETWSAPVRLPEGILGPVKNKPVRLGADVLLAGSSTEHAGWKVHMERSSDGGRTWTRTAALNDGRELGAIQPTVLPHGGGRVQILCRTLQGRIAESWSSDGGLTWSAMRLAGLPNPNAGIDAVVLADGRALLVYNDAVRGRENLSVALSPDGRSWRGPALVLESQPGEYSYPAVSQTPDGLVHVTYTHRRRHIKHVVLDPDRLEP